MKKFIYLIQSLETSKYKIGVSKNPSKRIKQIQTGNGDDLKLVFQYESLHYKQIEKYLHNKYSYLKTRGEWYYLGLEEELSFMTDCKYAEENIDQLIANNNEFI